jgi:hypothetical protein
MKKIICLLIAVVIIFFGMPIVNSVIGHSGAAYCCTSGSGGDNGAPDEGSGDEGSGDEGSGDEGSADNGGGDEGAAPGASASAPGIGLGDVDAGESDGGPGYAYGTGCNAGSVWGTINGVSVNCAE